MKSICLAVSCLIITSVAAADTITVPVGGDIQAAINGALDGDIIQLEAGEYFPTATIDTLGKEVSIIGASDPKTGEPTSIIDGQDLIRVLQCISSEGAGTVFENLVIQNGSANVGGGMLNSSSSPTLENCTFTGNSALGGGGMFNDISASPTLTDCTFTGNSAVYDGGGMYNWESSPTLDNCTFTGNSADDSGGGMYNEYYSSPTLTDTTVCSNTSGQIVGSWKDNGGNCVRLICQDTNEDGQPDCEGTGTDDYLSVPSEYATIELAIDAAAEGALIDIAAGTYVPAVTLDTLGKAITLRGAIDGDGNPTTIIDGQDSIRVLRCSSGEGADTVFENLYITGGSASGGGGMHNYSSSPTLENCTFTGNSALNGGGMLNDYSSSEISASPTLTDCTFAGNTAAYDGGGMFNDYKSNTTLTNCTFTGNSADYGGGMYNDHNSNPTLTNCTFTDNSAWFGGGMYNYNYSSAFLTDCTFTGNSAAHDGGGIYNYDDNSSSPTLTDTTVCSNTPDQVYGSFTDNGGNCLADACTDSDGDGIPDDCDDDVPPCPGDFNGDGLVDGADFGSVLAAWGSCPLPCPQDLNEDGQVNGADIGLMLSYWGTCTP